jgi:hypothetical protein
VIVSRPVPIEVRSQILPTPCPRSGVFKRLICRADDLDDGSSVLEGSRGPPTIEAEIARAQFSFGLSSQEQSEVDTVWGQSNVRARVRCFVFVALGLLGRFGPAQC